MIGAGLALIAKGSPWIDGKAMATASAASLLAALAACAFAFEHGRRVVATVAALAISAGVLWSNVLTYRGVWLAPQPAMAELASIGSRFAGEGPTLMTEYQPYGVRHFLRRTDPESAGELRRRVIPLLTGQGLEKGAYADLDQFQTGGILVYRTLVLRRSPAESRPPSPYRLVSRGRFYDVWQRPDVYAPIVRHLALGDAVRPGGRAALPRRAATRRRCWAVGPPRRRAPHRAGRRHVLGSRPSVRLAGELRRLPLPDERLRAVTLALDVPSPGLYTAWLGGSFRDRLRLSIDGRQIADARNHLTEPGTPHSARRVSGAGRIACSLRRPRPPSWKRRRPVRSRPTRPHPGRRRRAGRVRAVGRRADALRPESRLDRGTGARVISIVVPVRNGGTDLARRLDAVAAEHIDDVVELVVIDSSLRTEAPSSRGAAAPASR